MVRFVSLLAHVPNGQQPDRGKAKSNMPRRLPAHSRSTPHAQHSSVPERSDAIESMGRPGLASRPRSTTNSPRRTAAVISPVSSPVRKKSAVAPAAPVDDPPRPGTPQDTSEDPDSSNGGGRAPIYDDPDAKGQCFGKCWLSHLPAALGCLRSSPTRHAFKMIPDPPS